MVAPLQLLHTSCFAKQVFDIFFFFPEVAPNFMSLYYQYQTVIICLTQIDTPPAAFSGRTPKTIEFCKLIESLFHCNNCSGI